MKKSKILVTGGTGFVGRNLVPLLEKRYKIKILSREKEGKNIERGNLRDYDSVKDIMENIDYVIHLAYSKNYPENLLMTENLIKVCKRKKVRKIILISSMSAKRSHPDEYGKSKLEIEKIIKNSGMVYTILRPSIIYGKESTSFNFMIDDIKKIPFFTPVIGSGKYLISPVHISDVILSIEKCIKNKKTDRKEYDIPGEEKIYFVDLVNELKKEINVNKKNIYVPIWICKIIATIFPRIISKENIRNLTEDSLADIENAKKDFNYRPVKFSVGVKDGLI